jgi:hypothetical protein
MKHKLLITFGAGAAVLLGFGFAAGQQPANVTPPPPPDVFFAMEQGPGPEPFEASMGEHIEMLGLEGMHPGKVVTGAPFSATAVSETTQSLADGNHISRKTQTLLFRDGQGRFRKETTADGFGPLASGKPKTFIIIHDPVAGNAFALEPTQKIAHELRRFGGHLAGNGALTDALKEKMMMRRSANGADVQTEDLGKQTINGLVAEGTRHTKTIPAGQIGNEKAITIVSETWYSPDLQLVVMRKRSDPRFGETTYTLSNIQRKEPDASLFSVPSDYTIRQGPGHGPGGAGAHRRMNRASEAPAAPPTD